MGVLPESAIDKLVLQYLKKRKFSEAGKVLQLELDLQNAKEGGAGSPAPAWAEGAGEGALAEGVAAATAGQGDPEALARAYDTLASWADSTLVEYRPELSQVLYPSLLGSCEVLAATAAPSVALALLERHRARFAGAGAGLGAPGPRGELARVRSEELGALAERLRSAERRASGLARGDGGSSDAGSLAEAPVPVRQRMRLTTYASELLSRALKAPALAPILGIVGERLEVVEAEGAPPGPAEVAARAAAAAAIGATSATLDADTTALNQRAVDLRLLAGSVEDEYALAAAERAERAAEEAVAAAEASGGTKKHRAALAKTLVEVRAARERAVAERAEAPGVPLLPETDEMRVRRRAALERRAPSSVWAPVAGAAGDGDGEAGLGAARDATAGPTGSATLSGPSALPSALFATFVNSAPGVTSVAFSSDTRRVVCGSADATMRLFSLVGGGDEGDDDEAAAGGGGAAEARRHGVALAGHSGAVVAASFSPDDTLLLSASADGGARLWSCELARPSRGGGASTALARYECDGLSASSVAWAPEGAPLWFATGHGDGAARLWSTERGQAARVLAGHGASVSQVAWHPGCSLLATASRDGTARLWDLRAGGCVRVLARSRSPLLSVACSPDGASLATGDARGEVAIWDLAAGRLLSRSGAHRGPVWSLAYARGPHGPVTLASGGADGTLRLWEDRPAPEAAPAAGAAAVAPGAAPPAPAAAAAGDRAASPVATYRTKATPIISVAWSETNLLLAGGPLSLHRPPRARD